MDSLVAFIVILVLLLLCWGILWDVAGRIFTFWPFRLILALCLIPVFPWVCLVYLFMSKNKN